jgi:6-phosphogluconolactonase
MNSPEVLQSSGRSGISVFPDLAEASEAIARRLVVIARRAVQENGRFALALSGGSTPRLLYSLLAEKFARQIPWKKAHLFWGDERCVPKNHPQSNFRLAEETLISRVPIPRQNIHRIPAELTLPPEAAQTYEKTLRQFFRANGINDEGQTFDLILLGLGPDGHTASLFPGSRVLGEQDHWVAAVLAPSTFRPRQRITLTLPAINKSVRAFFLVAGAEKRKIMTSILQNFRPSSRPFPAAMVKPQKGVTWFIDREALGMTSYQFYKKSKKRQLTGKAFSK